MDKNQPSVFPHHGDRLLTTSQASDITGMSKAWFERKRVEGGGVPFVKLPGGAVRYSEATLRAWFDAHTRTSTSQA